MLILRIQIPRDWGFQSLTMLYIMATRKWWKRKVSKVHLPEKTKLMTSELSFQVMNLSLSSYLWILILLLLGLIFLPPTELLLMLNWLCECWEVDWMMKMSCWIEGDQRLMMMNDKWMENDLKFEKWSVLNDFQVEWEMMKIMAGEWLRWWWMIYR